MEKFLVNFKKSLENGIYEELLDFEQSWLRFQKISHHFTPGETIDMIYEGIESGNITYKPEINFTAFMKVQIKNMVSNRLKRLKNKFNGYFDEEKLQDLERSNGEMTENEIRHIEKNYDLEKLEEVCFEKILGGDEIASISLMEFIDGKKVKEIAEYLGIEEDEVYSGIRRGRYKIKKYLPDEFKKLGSN